eukprot:1789261-Ditylum_brightwellii.AAC.1
MSPPSSSLSSSNGDDDEGDNGCEGSSVGMENVVLSSSTSPITSEMALLQERDEVERENGDGSGTI